jgi:CRISPR-associated protein Cst2
MVVQISILAKVSGNVNADEVVGTRITLKKMYSSGGEVLPFVSARAIKRAIREALKQRGFDIDPFVWDPQAAETLKLRDSGDPIRYIDNDLFGYMVTTRRGETARRRQAPVALSYLKALRDTPIKAEFAARFPRQNEKEQNPIPFEVEVAEFIGRLNCLIYNNVGRFETSELVEKESEQTKFAELEAKGIIEVKRKKEGEKEQEVIELRKNEREKRLRAFLEIFLTPAYVLPRRTNSLNIPEYIAALIALSQSPAPIYSYLDYDFARSAVDEEKLRRLVTDELIKKSVHKFLLVDYYRQVPNINGIEKVSVTEAISQIMDFYFRE